jgi:ABC-type dipeptide/oligopeptide/nickel transport system permease subunit
MAEKSENVSSAGTLTRDEQALRPQSNLRIFWKMFRTDKIALAASVALLLLVAAAVFAPVVTPYEPNRAEAGARLMSPSRSHIFGTDELGRDVFSRVVYGGRISMSIGFLAVGIGLSVGGFLGLIAGYLTYLDNLIMRLMDILLAMPGILLAIAIVAALGPGLYEVMIAVGISAVPVFCRVMRSSVLSVKQEAYVDAARALGARHTRIIFRHILPNTFAPILVYGTLSLATAILAASILSFLGLGPQPPTSEWGAMVSAGRRYMYDTPHVTLFPGIAIFVVVLCFNLIGDSLRDALDPRLRTR